MPTLQASVFIATSLDGFIAREDGGLDWLDAANSTITPGEDCGYRAFFDTVDVLVMGRKSFEKVLSFDQWLYGDKPVIVLSRNPVPIPDSIEKTVSCSTEDPTTLVQRLEREGAKRIYVDGGVTIQRFLAEGLIFDITITVIPIILGAGIPLFGPLANSVDLRHVRTNSYDFGFVQTTYETIKRG